LNGSDLSIRRASPHSGADYAQQHSTLLSTAISAEDLGSPLKAMADFLIAEVSSGAQIGCQPFSPFGQQVTNYVRLPGPFWGNTQSSQQALKG
jgi:hypothetical protein